MNKTKKSDSSKKQVAKANGTAAGRTVRKQSSGSAQKVWRICHFQERFEITNNEHECGLEFIRMFVTSSFVHGLLRFYAVLGGIKSIVVALVAK